MAKREDSSVLRLLKVFTNVLISLEKGLYQFEFETASKSGDKTEQVDELGPKTDQSAFQPAKICKQVPVSINRSFEKLLMI